MTAKPEIIVTSPDPSVRALEIATREMTALREFLEAKINGMGLLMDERFRGVALQFLERDTRTNETAGLNQKALEAALAAAKELVQLQNNSNKEAITKSESSTDKRIDAIVTLMNGAFKATDDKVQALKERQDRGEGRSSGTNWLWGIVTGIIAIGIGLAALIIRH